MSSGRWRQDEPAQDKNRKEPRTGPSPAPRGRRGKSPNPLGPGAKNSELVPRFGRPWCRCCRSETRNQTLVRCSMRVCFQPPLARSWLRFGGNVSLPALLSRGIYRHPTFLHFGKTCVFFHDVAQKRATNLVESGVGELAARRDHSLE